MSRADNAKKKWLRKPAGWCIFHRQETTAMKISVPRETHPGETRAPLTPDSAAKLVKLGAQVEVEAGLGAAAGFPDEAYVKAGATVTADRKALIGSGDIVLRLRKPPVRRNCVAQAGRDSREPA